MTLNATVTVHIPGDKSLSHRALLFSSLLASPSTISGLLPSADVAATQRCLTQLGTAFQLDADGSLTVTPLPWHEPADVLMVDNSGTSIRLLAGLLAAQPFLSVLTGDAAIRRRPMARVIDPLRDMGAQINGKANDTLAPMVVRPCHQGLTGICYASPVSSAQVKSAILLAGLYATGTVQFKEPVTSRDHTERFFKAVGLDIETTADGWLIMAPRQIDRLTQVPGVNWIIPGDISSAAFFMMLASLTPGLTLTMPNVGLNPARTGIIDVLTQMGAHIVITNKHTVMGEPVGDITVTGRGLTGDLTLTAKDIPALVDEIPVLMVAGALMQGRLTVRDAEELRAKESDRLAAMADAFTQLGIPITMAPDGFVLDGQPNRTVLPVLKPLATHHDHRIVMSLAILNALLDAQNPWPIEGPEWVTVSFPDFFQQLAVLHPALTRLSTN